MSLHWAIMKIKWDNKCASISLAVSTVAMLVIIMIGTKAAVYIQPSELPSVPVSCRWNNSTTVLACHPSYLLVILYDILEALFIFRSLPTVPKMTYSIFFIRT